MIWLTVRQYRMQIASMLAIAVMLAIGMAFAADYVVRVRAELGVDTCVPLPNSNVNCFQLDNEWRQRTGSLNYLFYSLYVLPGLIASYVGGPLFAVEFERGTHRFAWTQNISRVRWAALKLGVVLLATLVAAIVLAPFGAGQKVFSGRNVVSPFETFELQGLALVSYFVFGIAAGAFFGAWSRRILGGMLLGLLVFGVVRAGVHNLRPGYQDPATAPYPYTTGALQPSFDLPPDAWIIGDTAIDLEGRPVAKERLNSLLREYFASPRQLGPSSNDGTFLRENGVIRLLAYQPADRFWTFQAIEAAIFTGLAALFAILTLWRVRNRDA
jgi:hypothetical protein